MVSKELTKDYIQKMVSTEPKWTVAAILALYERQTEDEKAEGSAKVYNRMGFNKFDAAFMTSLAEQLLADKFLSAKQLGAAQKVLKKYAGQLLRIAKEQAK